MCLNWRVLAGLAAVGIGVYLIAPGAILGLWPVLLLLACPLSMVVMMVGMRGMGAQQGQDATQTQTVAPVSREQQLAQLRAQLIGLGNQQAALAQQIEQLAAPDAAAKEQAPVVTAASTRR